MARVPQTAAIFGARGPFEVGAVIFRCDVLHGLRLFLDTGFGAVEFEEQHRRFAQREVRVAIDRAYRERIDELDARDRHAHLNRLDDGAHGIAHRREGADGGGNGFGLRIEAHRDFGNDAERVFGAYEQAREVVARRRFARACRS